jgi:hypothetical protein
VPTLAVGRPEISRSAQESTRQEHHQEDQADGHGEKDLMASWALHSLLDFAHAAFSFHVGRRRSILNDDADFAKSRRRLAPCRR